MATDAGKILDDLEATSQAERQALIGRDWAALRKLVSHKEILIERIEALHAAGLFTRSQLMRVERSNRRNHALANKLIEGVKRRLRQPGSGQTYNRGAQLNQKPRALLHRMG